MTEKDKRIAIIAGTVILAVLLLLLFFRSRLGTTALNSEALPEIGLNPIGALPGHAMVIPGLSLVLPGPNLSMIGSCCMDCSSNSAQLSFRQPSAGITYVTNQGDKGPTIYNYTNIFKTEETNTGFTVWNKG